ncbi:hypothetical protein N9D63_03150 [Opitutales bacterium]|jgi:hypothetical protein|nr:hypothetical protein [Opitutales bacterium]
MMEKMCANVGELSKEGNRWFGAVPEAASFFSIVTGKGGTEIIFENHSGNLVKLCWINYRGRVQSYGLGCESRNCERHYSEKVKRINFRRVGLNDYG